MIVIPELVVPFRHEPMPLVDLAHEINFLASQEEDVRLRLACAIYEAKLRVPQETGQKFYEWAKTNLRRSNGMPWSYWSLTKYVSWGKDPGKLIKSRKIIARLGKKARAIARTIDSGTRSVSDEVNLLMTIWEKTSPEARRIFLQQVTPIEQRRKKP